MKSELDTVIHLETGSVIQFVKKTFGLCYSASGMRDLLHRLDYSKVVQDYISTSRIDLVFLPSYSPNLNLIERLWGFFKKKVLHNRYYKDVGAFREACITFFREIDQYSKEISNFMNADFHIA